MALSLLRIEKGFSPEEAQSLVDPKSRTRHAVLATHAVKSYLRGHKNVLEVSDPENDLLLAQTRKGMFELKVRASDTVVSGSARILKSKFLIDHHTSSVWPVYPTDIAQKTALTLFFVKWVKPIGISKKLFRYQIVGSASIRDLSAILSSALENTTMVGLYPKDTRFIYEDDFQDLCTGNKSRLSFSGARLQMLPLIR